MITFKEFLKQKNIYTNDDYASVYNDDMEAIDPDLDVSKSQVFNDSDDSDGSNDLSDSSDFDEDDNVDEDGEGSTGGDGAVSIAPSVSAPSTSSDGSNIGGTTSSDIAQVPYGLNKNPDSPEVANLIKRLDSYL